MNKERLLECVADDQVKPITDEQIAEVEQRLHLRFPADFKRFIKKWNNAEIGSFYCMRLADITDLSYLDDPDYEPVAEQWAKDFGGSIPDSWDDFPDVVLDAVDLFDFADDGGESVFYLMIDRKDPEHYWILDVAEGDLVSCDNSVSAFLDWMLAPDDDKYFHLDYRTTKQKLADRLYGGNPYEPSRFMVGSLDDVPGSDAPAKDRIEGKSFSLILPTGELISMRYIPADADGGRSFWNSYYPVSCDQFLPQNRLDDSVTDGNSPAEVSAEDAEQFCSILNDYFAKSLPDGYAFALPSDAEYQRALKHAEWYVEKPKTGVFGSFLKLFIRPNPGQEHLTEVLKRNTTTDSGESKKLPFYLVLTSKTS